MKPLLTLRKYIIRYKKYVLLGFIFILLSNVFAIVIPPIVRESVDGVKLLVDKGELPSFAQDLPAFFQTSSGLALFAGLLVLGFALLKGVCMFFMRMTIIVMSRYIEYEQKNDIFKHYQKLGQGFYGKNYTGDLMNRISDDVSKVRMFTGPAIMYSLNLSCMIIMVVSLMFYTNAEITLYVLIPLPILAITIYFVSDAMNKKSDQIQRKLSDITSYAQETFAGIHVVKSYAAEDDYMRNFEALNGEYKDDNIALVKINGIFMPAVLSLVGMSILITVYKGGNAVVGGEFSLGNIVEFIIYVTMLTWPVASLGYVTSLVQRGAASQKRIDEFMNVEPYRDTGKEVIAKLSKCIEFKNVSFRYPETDVWVLKDVSFVIEANEKFGLIGTTGSGKSTIAKLLVGVYRPTKGSIMVDDLPIEQYSRINLNKLFGYVAQDVFLFSETLRDNILFGSTDATDEKNLKRAVASACLHKEINGFPKGLETMLGERGITLSGGQKQRTAIARALVKNPEILLIDDGLSAVDTKTEVAIKNSLHDWNKSQTFINISHRVSSVQDCKHIVFLDNGTIIEQGNHNEMILLNGIYADLFDKQMMVDDQDLRST